MAHTIQKRGFTLKPVTYCYNLIEEKAWFIPGFLRILQGKTNDRIKQNKGKQKNGFNNRRQFIMGRN